MKNLGIKPLIKPIRGGTDDFVYPIWVYSCPNIFAGGHNFHGKYEYVPVESMQKAVDVIVEIAQIVANRNICSKIIQKSEIRFFVLFFIKSIVNKGIYTKLVERIGSPISELCDIIPKKTKTTYEKELPLFYCF